MEHIGKPVDIFFFSVEVLENYVWSSKSVFASPHRSRVRVRLKEQVLLDPVCIVGIRSNRGNVRPGNQVHSVLFVLRVILSQSPDEPRTESYKVQLKWALPLCNYLIYIHCSGELSLFTDLLK